MRPRLCAFGHGVIYLRVATRINVDGANRVAIPKDLGITVRVKAGGQDGDVGAHRPSGGFKRDYWRMGLRVGRPQ
jgi:hypothetical protein